MQKEKSDKNLILNLTFELSVSVIDYCGLLDEMKKFTTSNQLLRSATSIGANVREAQNAESKNDFIHKFKIAAKEADETEYWLHLCQKANGLPNPDHLLKLLNPIMKIINKIITTTKRLSNKFSSAN